MTHLLLIGDSLIADYNWQKRMPHMTVQKHGIPGATAQDILDVLPSIPVHSHPDLVLVMVGTNDLYKENYDFRQTLKEIIQTCNQQFAGAEILLNNIFPMELDHLSPETIETVNCHIKELAIQTGCCLLDMHKHFHTNKLDTIFQEDKIHLTELGYELWCRNVLEHIAFLIESD